MLKRMGQQFDWNRMRGFLAVAEGGSLSAGARSLGLTQPTLGRQIAALEAELGLTLFAREGRGLRLTATGAELLAQARAMGEAAERLSLVAAGRSEGIQGRVRVTASDILSVMLMPKVCQRLARRAPDLRIEVVAANTIKNISRREADIAVRHERPTQASLYARFIHDGEARLFASTAYLDAAAPITSPADLAHHRWVAFGEPARMAAFMQGVGLPVTEENFRYGTEDGNAAWAMMRAGLGIAPMDTRIAATAPEMVEVLPELPPIRFPFWLVTHEELHTSPAIRLVFDTLAEMLPGPLART